MANGSRVRLLSMVVLALVFVSGVVVGVALDRRALASAAATEATDQVADADTPNDENESGDDEERRVPMYERVGLTDEQSARIDSIVGHHRQAMRDLENEFEDEYQAMRDLQREYRNAYNPRYWAIVDATRSAIRSVLDADQAARYDSLLNAFDRRRRPERSDSSGN